MSFIHLFKLVSSGHKYHNQLVRFSNNLTLKKKFGVLFPARCISTCDTKETEPGVATTSTNQYGFRNPSTRYIIDNADKYKLYKIEDINLMEENFESLKLLSDFVNSAESGSSEEEVPGDLKERIKNEIRFYGVNEFLKYVVLFPKMKFNPSRGELLKILDDELYSRFFDHERVFKLLFALRLCLPKQTYRKNLGFVRNSLYRILRKIQNISDEQLFLFFYNADILNPDKINPFKFDLQAAIVKVLPKVNETELGILAHRIQKMGFSLYTSTISGFIQQTVKEIESLSNLSFYFICQMILTRSGFNNVVKFQEEMLPHTSKLDNNSLFNLAMAGVNVGHVNQTLWEMISPKIKSELRDSPQSFDARNIERLVHFTTRCNIKDEELLKLSLERIQNEKEYCYDYISVVSICYHLIHHQIFPEKLLSSILSKNFRSEYMGKFNLLARYRYCYLNCYIEWEKPTHNFELMDSDEKKKFFKIFKFLPESNEASKSYRSRKEIKESLCQIYGDNSVCEMYVVPYVQPGIVMRFNKNLEPQLIPEEFTSQSNPSFKKALADDHFWVFIILFLRADFVNNSEELTLENQTHIRQLQELGFIPFVVKNLLWREQVKNNTTEKYVENDIINNIKKLIQEKIQTDGKLSNE